MNKIYNFFNKQLYILLFLINIPYHKLYIIKIMKKWKIGIEYNYLSMINIKKFINLRQND